MAPEALPATQGGGPARPRPPALLGQEQLIEHVGDDPHGAAEKHDEENPRYP